MADTSGFTRRPETGKQIIGRLLLRGVLVIVAASVVAYLCDYLVLRIKMATNHQPFDTVTVHPMYLVPRKDQKTEYMPGDPTDQQCTNSLFPQMGDAPCWYLKSHPDQQISM